MSTSDVDPGPKRCHFFPGKTDVREFDHQKSHPCAGKTGCAESGGFVVVSFACVACNIFDDFTSESPWFSPNALKRVTLENPSFLLANTNRVLVQDLSSKTVFLRGHGQCMHFDNFASRLGKSGLCALQRHFERASWTTYFQKNGANHAAKCMFLSKSVWKIIVLEN